MSILYFGCVASTWLVWTFCALVARRIEFCALVRSQILRVRYSSPDCTVLYCTVSRKSAHRRTLGQADVARWHKITMQWQIGPARCSFFLRNNFFIRSDLIASRIENDFVLLRPIAAAYDGDEGSMSGVACCRPLIVDGENVGGT